MKPTDENNPRGGNSKLGARRRALAIPQADLAVRCGVSRQFLSLAEAGRTQPNVQVALRLAAELGCSVEDLFGGGKTSAEATGLPVDLVQPDLPAGTRLDVVRLGGRWIAHAADSTLSLGSGFAAADAVLARTDGQACAVAHRPTDALEGNVVIAGCDPALALLRGRGELTSVAGRCCWVNCGSARALDLLSAGYVHAAGLHYGGADGTDNLRQIVQRDPHRHWQAIRFTRWESGWMIRPSVGSAFTAIDSLGDGRLRLANREVGSGSRLWLDHALKTAQLSATRVAGYDSALPNHWECARALSDGRADVAVGPRAIAAAFGLDFRPVEEVAFDLVVPRAHLDHPRLQAILQRLHSHGFRREIASLPGYTADHSGQTLDRKKR